MKNTAQTTDERSRSPRAPQVSLPSVRWSTRPSAPRLVTFSWGAVAPTGRRR